jgi:hypothetical protein
VLLSVFCVVCFFFHLSQKLLPSGKTTHCFLTHNWADDEEQRSNHKRVSRINKALQAKGYVTWFDEDRMTGQIRQKMTEGVDQTVCVIVCVTKKYLEKINRGDRSDNCCFEFEFASRRHSNSMIPVVMERVMLNLKEWKGRLDSELGGILYIDMSKDEEAIFHRKVNELADKIDELTESCNSVV